MKLKSLALAVLAAVSVPSFAAINTYGALGEGEYVLLVHNAAGSFVQDLGITPNDIKAKGSFSLAINSAEWSKFVAFGGTDTQWAIVSVQPDLDLPFIPGGLNTWNTVNVNQPVGSIVNIDLGDAVGAVGLNYFPIVDTQTYGGANGYRAIPVGATGYVDPAVITYRGLFNVGNAIGTTADMVYMTESSDDSSLPAIYEMLNTKASFDGTTVTIGAIPAVPEPSTYAMLAAGLAAVGFVARRRKAA